eukprot:s6620_g2.t1
MHLNQQKTELLVHNEEDKTTLHFQDGSPVPLLVWAAASSRMFARDCMHHPGRKQCRCWFMHFHCESRAKLRALPFAISASRG